MTEAKDKRLEELRRKHLEEIHHKKVGESQRQGGGKGQPREKEKGKGKPAGQPSRRAIAGDLLDEIDLSADLTVDPNEASKPGVGLEEKIKRTRPILVAVMVVIAAILLLNHYYSRGRDLSFYLDQIKPGMSYDAVMEIIPSGLIIGGLTPAGAGHVISPFTYVVDPGISTTSYLSLGYRGLFPKDDRATIYFDEAKKVVGLQFSFEKSEGWTPSWGSSEWSRRAMGQ